MHYKIMSVNKKTITNSVTVLIEIILSVLDITNLCNFIADNGNLLDSKMLI